MRAIAKIKKTIWEAASEGRRPAFDTAIIRLCKIAMSEWWKLGWTLAPKDAGDIVRMLDNTATRAHMEWRKSVRRGDSPDEDISPGEGFALCSRIIEEAMHHGDREEPMPLLAPEDKVVDMINEYGILNADIGANEASLQAFEKYCSFLSEDDRKLDMGSLYDHFDNDLKVVGRKMFGLDKA